MFRTAVRGVCDALANRDIRLALLIAGTLLDLVFAKLRLRWVRVRNWCGETIGERWHDFVLRVRVWRARRR